jgi:uncharacterized protein YcbK (DUF882 family)
VTRAASLVAAVLALSFAGTARGQTSKKDAWFADKARAARAAHRRARTPGRSPVLPVVMLKNLWTNEVLPVMPGKPPGPAMVSEFLRCHYQHERHSMDRRLMALVLRAARTFRARLVEIVSGYRSPAYNAHLRSQGRQVARESQHLQGRAVDFRLPEISTERLLAFVKSQSLGGVGYYPHSRFVHADTGPVRYWKGR